MPVPDYQAFMLPVLTAVAGGKDHAVREVRNRLAAETGLSPGDRAEMLPSGKQSVFDNRVGWAKTYLEKAGLLQTVRRGVYRIAPTGQTVLASKPTSIDKEYLKQFEPFRSFLAIQNLQGDENHRAGNADTITSATPQEQAIFHHG